MKRIFRNVTSMALALLLVITLIPVTPALYASAEETGNVVNGTVDEIAWAINRDTGVMTLTGSGEFAPLDEETQLDFENLDTAIPYFQYRESVTSLVVGEGITGIGDYSFILFSELESVELPTTLKSIGAGAFMYDMDLAQINFPEGLESIGHSAFLYDMSIESITFPSTLSEGYRDSFSAVYGVKELVIKDGFSATDIFIEMSFPLLLTMTNYSQDVVVSGFMGCASYELIEKYFRFLKAQMELSLYVELYSSENPEMTEEEFYTLLLEKANEIFGTEFTDIEEMEEYFDEIAAEVDFDDGVADYTKVYCPEESAQHEYMSGHFFTHYLIGEQEPHDNCFVDLIDHISYTSERTYMECMNGYETGSENKRYFRYDYGPEIGDVLTVYYKDDTVKEYTYKFDNGIVDGYNTTRFMDEDNNYIPDDEFSYREHQSYASQWTPGGENYWTFRYLNKECVVPVVIEPNPVASISYVSSKTYIENMNGYWATHDDTEIYIYYVSPAEGDVLTVNYIDDPSKTFTYSNNVYVEKYGYYTNAFVSEDGEILTYSDYSCENSSQYSNPWTIGGDNSWTFTYMGRSCQVAATVIANPVASLSYSSVRTYSEGCGGWWNFAGSDNPYYHYETGAAVGDVLTVNYTDGSVKTYTYTDSYNFKDNDSDEILTDCNCYNNQSVTNPWTPGGENYYWTFAYAGKEVQIPVEIAAGDVASISYDSVREYFENADGYYPYGPDGDFYYYTDTTIGDKLTVNYSDGTTKVFVYTLHLDEQSGVSSFGFYCGDETISDYSTSNNQYGNPWKVGKDNYYWFIYGGKICKVSVEIKPENIESIYHAPMAFTENDGSTGYMAYRTPEENFWYYFAGYCTGDVFTVNYKDGTSKDFVYKYHTDEEIGYSEYGYYAEDGEKLPVVVYTNQYENPWLPGEEVFWEVGVRNFIIEVPVTIYAAHDHDFTDTSVKDETTLYTAATCEDDAQYYYTCTVCGKKGTDYYTAEGTACHKLGETAVESVASTCETAGYDIYKCDNCEYTEKIDRALDSSNHTGGTELRNVKAVSCEVDGYTGDTYCLGCNAKISDGEAITAEGHKLGETAVESVASTCKTAGYDIYKCDNCEYTEKIDRALDSSNHTGGTELRNVKAVSCKADGYTGDTYCLGCNAKISDGNTITKLAHTAGSAVKENQKAATCTSDGGYDEVVYCTVCSSEISRTAKKIAATGHTDNNGDGRCDTCGKDLTQKQPESFWDKIVAFFNRIIDWFKNLFG